MVPMLTPMAVCRKLSFDTHPPLIDDHEIAACVGLLCRIQKAPLPEGENLEEIVQDILAKDIPEEFQLALRSRTVRGDKPDWRMMMEEGYTFNFKMIPHSFHWKF